MVELVLHISRGDDDRLTGSVRVGDRTDAHEFSGTLELMRVFEQLVPADLAPPPNRPSEP